MASTSKRLVLASASTARASLLQAAGVEFTVSAADIDEAAIKAEAVRRGDSPDRCATRLAEAKALRISERDVDAMVVGADQLLVVGDQWFDKPVGMIEAAEQLRHLRGRTHTLVTVCCAARRGAIIWHAASSPRLTMRRFSEDFLRGYLAAEGEALLGSVGAYRLEGRGAQLFERIEGDHFAVLGLPLIELLAFLRERGVVGA